MEETCLYDLSFLIKHIEKIARIQHFVSNARFEQDSFRPQVGTDFMHEAATGRQRFHA